jgi:hypothetical protein
MSRRGDVLPLLVGVLAIGAAIYAARSVRAGVSGAIDAVNEAASDSWDAVKDEIQAGWNAYNASPVGQAVEVAANVGAEARGAVVSRYVPSGECQALAQQPGNRWAVAMACPPWTLADYLINGPQGQGRTK